MRRLGPLFATFSLITLASAPALAQSWGARLVKALDRVGASRLVADDHGKVHVSAILPPGVSPGALGLVGFDATTASMQLTPAQVIALGDAHPEIELFLSPPLKPLLNVAKGWTHAEAFRKATGYDGTGVAVGILDTGIDVLHADFRNADGSTRIKWLLQMGFSGGKYPEMEKKYCFDRGATCLILDEADINAAIAQNQTAGTYDGTGHGTHVASLAAGNGGPSKTKTPRYVGVAPAADLIIGAMDTFHDDDVAWTTQFIFDRADERKQPCVVNLSLGSDFGAHDGSDLLGRRLAGFIGDDKPGHAITVAAGNSGSLYLPAGEDLPWGIHTETHVYENADVHVPVWAPKSEAGRVYLWITFDPGDEVSVGLDGPGGAWLGDVAPGHENAIEEESRTAGIVNNKFKDGAALVPPTNGAVLVWSGKWEEGTKFAIHLSGHGHAQMWLTSTGDLADSLTWFEHGIKQGTINVPAADPSLLAVGCSINRIAWPLADSPLQNVQLAGDFYQADSMCYFSSAGPTPDGVMKPEITAPGGFVVGAMARTADPRIVAGSLFDQVCPEGTTHCYVADDTHGVAAGTSMSSPQVAGAIALLFQANPKLTQARVTDILQAGARYPKGEVKNERQLGVGSLDLLGALRALGDEEADFANPDPAKSWYVLSSAYARPDAKWPVEGTIELRRSDGEVAHALTGNLITLDVTNGVVLQPPTKIRHGLYRFKVAGAKAQGGDTMSIDVRYDGKSLGVRELPIESDIWRSTVAADAVGGCAIHRENKPLSPLPWTASALAILSGLAIRRASRRDRRRF